MPFWWRCSISVLSLFIFRGVAASIPQVLDGTAVINGDELVPFFNPTSQLIDQAAGKFNQLTNGYEFRVRYAFLTTWMRYYKVLPFAIILVIPCDRVRQLPGRQLVSQRKLKDAVAAVGVWRQRRRPWP